MRATVLALASVLALAACASPPPPIVIVTARAADDRLYEPARVEPGRLEYASDRSTFAPVLTERAAYPTQPQANDAYRRHLASAPPDLRATSVRLFGCKPGAIDPQTARVARYRGPVVLCATDFLDPSGAVIGRRPVNFAYARGTWAMHPVDPPRSPAPWLNRERSPNDPWSWLPFRDRYE
ncbi:hypothetical protein [uncultured Enterovirga sp.]|uniref:hypothetical protein n=1 Tax=uncultured Enterovirga sp. TaxID=2026352 RepID=UPI0035CA2231